MVIDLNAICLFSSEILNFFNGVFHRVDLDRSMMRSKLALYEYLIHIFFTFIN